MTAAAGPGGHGHASACVQVRCVCCDIPNVAVLDPSGMQMLQQRVQPHALLRVVCRHIAPGRNIERLWECQTMAETPGSVSTSLVKGFAVHSCHWGSVLRLRRVQVDVCCRCRCLVCSSSPGGRCRPRHPQPVIPGRSPRGRARRRGFSPCFAPPAPRSFGKGQAGDALGRSLLLLPWHPDPRHEPWAPGCSRGAQHLCQWWGRACSRLELCLVESRTELGLFWARVCGEITWLSRAAACFLYGFGRSLVPAYE